MSSFQSDKPSRSGASAVETEAEADLSLPPPLGVSPPAAGANIRRTVLALALPALADQFLQMLLLWSDSYLAGQLKPPEDAICAVGMGGQVMMLVNVLFTAIGVGAMAIVARCIGAGQRDEANRIARQAMLLGVLVGAATATLMFVLAPAVLHGLGLRGRALADGIRFVRIFMPGLCIGAIMFMGNACLRGAGDTIGSLMAIAFANIVNIAVAWTLVHGWFGLPKMGVSGIAVGTLSAYIAGGLFMLWMVRSGWRPIHVRFRPLGLHLATIGRMLRVGSFASLESLIFACASTVIVAIIAHPPMGEADYASWVLTIRLEAASFLPGFAFGIAGGALVGQSLGAGRPDRAAHSGWWAYLLGGGVMTLMGLVFILWPQLLVYRFVNPAEAPEVAAKTVQMLRICGFVQPFLGMLMVFAGCLKGAGDTRYPAAITFGGVFGMRMPGAFIAARVLGFGVVGVWCVMMTDLVVRGSLMTWRFAHGGWKRARV